MITTSTIDKLIEMRLTAMSDAYRQQLSDPSMQQLDFEERFATMVDIGYTRRKNNRLKRLINCAGFEQPDASIMDINYTSGRKLNKDLIHKLASCAYITEYRNIFINDATGCGKTYMANAFGMEACKQFYKTKYVRLPDFLIDMTYAREEGVYKKILAKYTRPSLLIINEWLLLKPTPAEAKDIIELLHHRRKKLPLSFALNTSMKGGTINLAAMILHSLMPFLIVLCMMPILLTLRALMLLKTYQ